MQDSSFEKENYMETALPDSEGELFPGTVISTSVEANRAVLTCNNSVALELTALNPSTVRLRFTTTGRFSDGFSYATLPGSFSTATALTLTETESNIEISTTALTFKISREALRIRIEDTDGHLVSEDEKGFHWEENASFGGTVVQNSRYIQSGEQFHGLGDKSSTLDMRGRRFQLWGSDTYAYGENTDPLYKNIPFFISHHHGHACGFFFDNTFRSYFDFGKERSSINTFWAQGGEMDYTVIYGPSVPAVSSSFARLTGTPELPPLWALGYHQCKWSYKTEAEFKSIATSFRKHKIPCDALYLDIDYMDGFRCFTWNLQAFPDPEGMVKKLEDDGFKTVAIIDPGIKIDPEYDIYQQGIENDVFCKRMDGPLFTGNVWPGPCHFPDFTSAGVREWWSTLFDGLVKDVGIRGIWNDMNEPAVFTDSKTFPRDVRHDFDGHPCSHRKAHNVYGSQMALATQQGMKRSAPDQRPFVITRSAYAGAWRHTSAWTGDNVSDWEHLRIANIQCQRLSMSGFSFVGSDIGGFLDETNGELFARWIQMGVFHPFCRTHSSGEHGDQEPWSFGEPYTSVIRKFIELRYSLLPYLYTTFWQHTQTGAPFLRSLFYLDADNHDIQHRVEEFGVGDHMLVCPISKPKQDGRWLYLPTGVWYEFWTDKKETGGEEVWADSPLDRAPVYIKAGAVIPMQPAMQYVGEKNVTELELHIYPATPGTSVTSQIYEDAGDGYSYTSGQNNVRSLTVTAGKLPGDLSLNQRSEGNYNASYNTFKVVLHGLNSIPTLVTIDGQEFTTDTVGRTREIAGVPISFAAIDIEA